MHLPDGISFSEYLDTPIMEAVFKPKLLSQDAPMMQTVFKPFLSNAKVARLGHYSTQGTCVLCPYLRRRPTEA
jgi:hypothetical protein